MGRAINMENDLERLRVKVERLETAFEGLASTVESLGTVSTSKTHIDLHAEETKPKKKKKLVEKATA
jgi:hypothetical protein